MRANNILQIFSVALLIIFSVSTFCLNFSFMTKEQIEEQAIAVIMKKEEKIIKNMSIFKDNLYEGIINNKTDFYEFRDYVNGTNGKPATTFTGRTIILNNDIDFKGEDYLPVGTHASFFQGTFDGKKYALKNLKISSAKSSSKDLGAFGVVVDVTIKNLTVTIDSITIDTSTQNIGAVAAGGIVGAMGGYSHIYNCLVLPVDSDSLISVNDQGKNNVFIGGIVGYSNASNGKVYQCANYVNIENESYSGIAVVGGIAGELDFGTLVIDECYSSSSLKGGCSTTWGTYVGGIFGRNAVEGAVLTISNCLNNSSISAISDYTFTSDDDDNTGTLRTDDDVTVSYVKNNSTGNWVYNIKAAGICGYTTSGTISKCVNLKNSVSGDSYDATKYDNVVYQTEYNNFIYYFYGRLDNISGLTNDYTWYGDYIDIRYYQTIKNYREISHGGTITRCYAPSIGAYYNVDNHYIVKDAVFRGLLNGRDGNYYKFESIPLADLLKGANTDKTYVSSTSYTSGNSFTFNGTTHKLKNVYYSDFYKYFEKINYWKISGNTLYLYEIDITDGWYNCDVAITYQNQLSFNSLGTPNLTSIGQNENYLFKSLFDITPEIYRSLDDTGYKELGTSYSSYFNSHFVSGNNNNSNRERYTNDSKSVIKSCNIKVVANSSGNFDIQHSYDYDYRYYYFNHIFDFGYVWDDSNPTTHTICTVTNRSNLVESRPSGLTNITTSTLWANVSYSLGNSLWINTGSGVTLKWLKWENSYVSP